MTDLNVFLCNKALQAVAERNVKPATLAAADRALRAFTAWLYGVELLPKNPMQGRKRPKLRWEPKQVLSQVDIQKLFAVAKADARYRERNIAILHLLLACGLRAGEVAALQLSDIDWTQSIVKVNGKTGFGQVPIDRQTLQALRRYVTHSRKATAQVSHVFVFNKRPITAETVSRQIARLGRRADIGRPIGPHICRHTFATAFIEAGGDVFSLKRILRHTTLFTSMQYVHNSTASLRGQMENGSPIRGLKL
ncbi:tyrosine-type recombinase/integrase [Deinococcus phoenicis]|uniref:tyrosine-type recombinase/integrase n=1 Tax=Deinococcus phoenicis TaxID=1476583 RepID=UPI001376B470|nr:site-specific integrase [Deinococcus phoenicis]